MRPGAAPRAAACTCEAPGAALGRRRRAGAAAAGLQGPGGRARAPGEHLQQVRLAAQVHVRQEHVLLACRVRGVDVGRREARDARGGRGPPPLAPAGARCARPRRRAHPAPGGGTRRAGTCPWASGTRRTGGPCLRRRRRRRRRGGAQPRGVRARGAGRQPPAPWAAAGAALQAGGRGRRPARSGRTSVLQRPDVVGDHALRGVRRSGSVGTTKRNGRPFHPRRRAPPAGTRTGPCQTSSRRRVRPPARPGRSWHRGLAAASTGGDGRARRTAAPSSAAWRAAGEVPGAKWAAADGGAARGAWWRVGFDRRRARGASAGASVLPILRGRESCWGGRAASGLSGAAGRLGLPRGQRAQRRPQRGSPSAPARYRSVQTAAPRQRAPEHQQPRLVHRRARADTYLSIFCSPCTPPPTPPEHARTHARTQHIHSLVSRSPPPRLPRQLKGNPARRPRAATGCQHAAVIRRGASTRTAPP
jgi:hypothetical protein